MIRKIYLVIALMVLGYSAFAEGYAVNVQGNKQIGMGHVGTALNWDASSLQFNPGALATLEDKFSFTAGATFISTTTEFTGMGVTGVETDNPLGTPFYLYGSMKLNDDLAVGLGVYTPFGNKVDWGKDWVGKNLVQDISLAVIYIQPTISYQLADWLSVGAGLNVVYGDFELNKAFPVVHPTTGTVLGAGTVKLSGSTVNYGFNAGVFIQANEEWSFGISYRSEVEMDIDDGDATFVLTPDALSASFPDNKVSAKLPMPASLNLGVAYQINEDWLVSADVNFVAWDTYKSLDFTFTPSTNLNSVNKREWDNSMTYRIGAQYTASEKLDLRAGFYYDETPSNAQYLTPETPGATKIGISTGFTYKVSDRFAIDGSLLYIRGEKRTGFDTNATTQLLYQSAAGFGGKYQNTGLLPGIGITYSF